MSWVRAAFQSLAFLPLPMMLGALLIGIGLLYLELNTNVSRIVTDPLPSHILSSADTARSILALLIGGLITLTVFTFTQMMTLFSQVANSYSPRLLPYFTANRSLQFVMGTYLSVIILSIIVLLSIRGDEEGYIPNLSVLLCIFLGVACLVIFLYFVTTISNKIQVTEIIKEIYRRGVKSIEAAHDPKNFEERFLPHDLTDWYAIPSPIEGFIGTVNYKRLSKLAKKHRTRFYIGTARGMFVPRYYPLLYSENELDEEVVDQALQAVSPIYQKFTDWRLPPVRLLTEIAVKAMSPGINDPGTAIDVMDRLTGLLLRLMRLPEYNFYQAKEDGGEVWLVGHHFIDILAAIMQQLRQYSKADVLVVRRMFQMLFHLLGSSGESLTYQQAIRKELNALMEDARANLKNSTDRSVLAAEIRQQRSVIRKRFEDTDFLLDARLEQAGIKG